MGSCVMYRAYAPIVMTGTALGLAMAAPIASDAALLNVSWRYNWAAVDTAPDAPGEFVPMLWSGNPSPSIARDYNGVILALNEPDNPHQLDITPQEAARRLARLREYYHRATLAAPGVLSYNAAWLADFAALARPDIWTIHAYVEGPYASADIIRQLRSLHNITGGRVWVTEYGVLSGDLTEFAALTDWMLAQSWIERIAAYTNRQDYSQPWAIAPGVELVTDVGQLTEIGKWYAAR